MNAVQSDTCAGVPAPTAAGLIVNVVAFQIGWFACVLGAARGWPWAGTALAAVIVAWHVARAVRPAQELRLIAAAMLMGALFDSSLAALGWLAFASGTLVDGTAPHWILAMWALFATTLNVSLNWLKGRLVVAALLGAAAGPLSYWAGARLGAVVLADPVHALGALAVGWAIMMPALTILARRFDGYHATNSQQGGHRV